jgi:hypothetical protein
MTKQIDFCLLCLFRPVISGEMKQFPGIRDNQIENRKQRLQIQRKA